MKRCCHRKGLQVDASAQTGYACCLRGPSEAEAPVTPPAGFSRSDFPFEKLWIACSNDSNREPDLVSRPGGTMLRSQSRRPTHNLQEHNRKVASTG
jgi:hypothetical protein